MKPKGSASLYEVLKSASRPAGEPAPAAPAAGAAPEAGPTSLQERLAAYKARKLAEAVAPGAPSPAPAAAPAAVAEATPPPAPPRAVEAPRPAPEPVRPAPAPSAAPAAPTLVMTPEAEPGPGERVFRLSYNNAAFAALVAVGLLFVAYALGVQSGKRRAVEAGPTPAAAPRVAAPVPAEPVPPPPPAREYTIRLAEWKYGTAKERLNAGAAADDLKRALERAGIRGAEKMPIQRGSEPRLVLVLDRVRDAGSEAARQRLATLQRLKVGTQTPFAQASYEEIAPR